jgi:hypothetical protein
MKNHFVHTDFEPIPLAGSISFIWSRNLSYDFHPGKAVRWNSLCLKDLLLLTGRICGDPMLQEGRHPICLDRAAGIIFRKAYKGTRWSTHHLEIRRHGDMSERRTGDRRKSTHFLEMRRSE